MSKSTKKYDHKKYRDKLRNKHNEAGLCIMCGKEPQRETSKMGDICHERSVNNRIKLRKKRVAEGKCGHCLIEKPIKGMKLCPVCREKKQLTSDQRLRKRCLTHGVTEKDYKYLFRIQGGVCAICKGVPNGRWKQLNIDHCHKTGTVRGLLCSSCNKALGCYQDSKEILLSAIEYLNRF